MGRGYAPLLDAVRGLRWPARRRVPGVLPGAHPARLRGPGGEFSEYRAYRQGDDPRRIDWRLLARSDRAYVRLADDHALLPTVCVVDASASMAFPERGTTKWGVARALAVGLAAVAHAAGDPVGLVAGRPDDVRVLAPRSRRGVVHELAGALDGIVPGGGGGLGTLVGRTVGGGTSAGTRLVLIGDYLDDDLAAVRRAAAAHAAAGGEVYAVHVVAVEELAPGAGLQVAVDPEDPRVRRPLDGAARRVYAARFGEWRDEVARTWREAGAAYTLVRTDEPGAHAVRRVIQGHGAAEPAADPSRHGAA